MGVYEEYLSSYAWRVVREQVLARDQYCCRLCEHTENLQVHHRTYARLGKEDLNDLTTLCGRCHDLVTDHQRRRRYAGRLLPLPQDVAASKGEHQPITYSSYKDSDDAPNGQISLGRREPPFDAQWTIGRPPLRLGQADEGNHSEAKKTEANHEEISRLEWRGRLYLFNSLPCVPDVAQKATLCNAAKTLKLGKKLKAGLFVYDHAMLTYDGPTDLDALWADERFRDRRPMKVSGSMVMRTRPRFEDWAIDMVIGFDDEVLNAGQVDQCVHIGGRLIGLLEGRPAYGRYTAKQL